MQFTGGRSRHNTGQMVMQRAALIVCVVHAMVVMLAVMADMMVVNVVRCAVAAFDKVGGDVSLRFYKMLQMSADQRRYAGDLG